MPRPKLSPLIFVVIVVVIALASYTIFSVGVSLAYISLPVLACTALAWFLWRVWGRLFWRANHIAHIRERRLLDEAARR